MKNKTNVALRVLVILTLLLSQLTMMSEAKAIGNGIVFTFAASNPETYDHTVGGGQWNSGRKNVDILETLEGKDFKCDETVSYLTKVQAPDTDYLRGLGAITLDMKYSITMDTTGQPGVALGEPVTVGVNVGDPANVNNGNSVASTVDTSQTGPMFSKGALLLKTFRLTGVEAGETIIFRFNVKIRCQVGSKPTGNLQVKFLEGAIATLTSSPSSSPNIPLSGGNETVSLKSVDALAFPSIVLAKTVTTATGTCPGQESITIDPSQSVKFCYVVTNDSNSGGQTGAPLYNMSNIIDDNGSYPGFEATLTSGLTDIDLDGQVDDLAPGASASGSYITSFATTENVTVTNTATINGYSLPVDGTLYSATDTAQVIVVPAGPALTNYENLSTLQRRLFSRILAAANVVANRGRRGPANFIVTNAAVASALQDISQFTFAPFSNTLTQNNGTLYPVGSLAGMTVYVDQNMSYSDTRVLVGRKGGDDEPGLKFMPYMMAESIQTISEGTMSPKIAVKSRYALVEAGMLPETMYLTFYVNVPSGGLA